MEDVAVGFDSGMGIFGVDEIEELQDGIMINDINPTMQVLILVDFIWISRYIGDID